MKKFIGAISSAVMGALAFVFFALAAMTQKMTIGSVSDSESFSAWDMLEYKIAKMDSIGFTIYKIATIAMIVVACLLILSAVVLLLKNLNVFKTKINFTLINNILLAVFAGLALVAVIAMFVFIQTELGDVMNESFKAFAGVGAWLNLVFGALLCLVSCLTAKKQK